MNKLTEREMQIVEEVRSGKSGNVTVTAVNGRWVFNKEVK
jgi:hypothetical protein